MRPQEFKKLGIKVFVERDLVEGIQQKNREKALFFDPIQDTAKLIFAFAVTVQSQTSPFSHSNDCLAYFMKKVLTGLVQIIA